MAIRLLYCSAGLNGLDSLLFTGFEEERGLPSQTKVLKGLLEDPEFEVTILCGDSENREQRCAAPWLQHAYIKIVKYKIYNHNIILRAYSSFKEQVVLSKVAEGLITTADFDFIYLQGENVSEIARLADKYGIPCGQRAYGSSLGQWMSSNILFWIYANFRNRGSLAVIKRKKEFVLATDDGSDFDRIARRVCGVNLPYTIYKWMNGVDFPTSQQLAAWDGLRRNNNTITLFCGARIEKSKNQLFALKVLHELVRMGCGPAELVLAGGIYDKKYFKKLVNYAEINNLTDNIFFLGEVARSEVQKYHRISDASFFTYEKYSRGNSFLEALSVGAIPVVYSSDDSVSSFVINFVSGISVVDVADAARKIKHISKDRGIQAEIRKNSSITAKNRIPSWTQRVNKEIQIIKDYATNKKG